MNFALVLQVIFVRMLVIARVAVPVLGSVIPSRCTFYAKLNAFSSTHVLGSTSLIENPGTAHRFFNAPLTLHL